MDLGIFICKMYLFKDNIPFLLIIIINSGIIELQDIVNKGD
ncbi:hypothetical protein Thert_01188 [Thermoanaerobacterium thermosaccharolyticum]|uniref:Uncharacterized protein n=1 Tax=Thermoanaerobacterium thermosaccharolyticum TaxID=1517 RepID=A0A223HXS7_THETR|nr:hypothetical protein Thert_01188 [Thermoanaerobacterium thermosaccharolyticum]